MKKSDEISWKKHQLCNSKWKKHVEFIYGSKSRHVSIAFLSMIFYAEVISLAPNPLAKKCIVSSRWLGVFCWRFTKKAAKRAKQRGRQDPNSDEEHRDFVLFWKKS